MLRNTVNKEAGRYFIKWMGQNSQIDDFIAQNDKLYGMKVVEDSGDSENLKVGQR